MLIESVDMERTSPTLRRFIWLLGLSLLGCSGGGESERHAPRREFVLGWSASVGSVPWEFAERAGIVKGWGDRYGLKIEVMQFTDRLQSIKLFAEGKITGVAATATDALMHLTRGKRTGTALILGDSSNGNDGIVSRVVGDLAGLRRKIVHLVEFSVSQYLLERALHGAGIPRAEVTVVGVSEEEIPSLLDSRAESTVSTWNPHLDTLEVQHRMTCLFDSRAIPDEILNLVVVDSDTLNCSPGFGTALVGIWYETLQMVLSSGAEGSAARADMASLLGITPERFEAQLRSTRFFKSRNEVRAFLNSEESDRALSSGVEFVREKLTGQGSLPEGAALGIGIDERIVGGRELVPLRFDTSWFQTESLASTQGSTSGDGESR